MSYNHPRVFPHARLVLELDGRRYALIVYDIDVSFEININGIVFEVRMKRDVIDVRMKHGLLKAARMRSTEDVARSFARFVACFTGLPVRIKLSRLLPSVTVKPEEC